MNAPTWEVHKFGGSSLTDVTCFRRVAGIVRSTEGRSRAVIVSAMGGMTDALLGLVNTAETSPDGIAPGIAAIEGRYRATASELLGSEAAAESVLAPFADDLADATSILQAVSLVSNAEPRSRDIIAGFGEIWAARLLAAYLNQGDGRSARWLDARELIVVRHGEMGPAVLWDASRRNVAKCLEADGGIAVVTGYIATDDEGLPTTLGRNGSDYSASIVAALLDAASITIWTDVDGVMTADPNRVPEATVMSDLSYNEAMELAYFGAKVIHPQTMAPAVQHGIPIWIRNTFNAAAGGSRIGDDGNGAGRIKGVTSIDDVALLNLEGAGMIGVPGTADRLFGALRDAGISVVLISQASSEHSICFAVPADAADEASRVVSEAFAAELEQNLIQRIDVAPHCSVVAVVGDGMAGMPGIAAKFFGTLGNAGINVRAIAQGSSERNISAVVAREHVTRALRAAHSGFYLSAKTLSIGLVGPGNVGGTLLDQVAKEAGRLLREFNLDFRIRGIATSQRMLLAERSIDLDDWRALLDSDHEPLDWDQFAEHVNVEHLPHAAIIDCSASEEVADQYVNWLAQGIHVVTPNKKAHSGPLESYDRIHETRRRHNAHFLYEATVGAGLPIIETLRDLRQTGDEIFSIEGIFSGTLAYLFNVYDGSPRPFSAIVREARDNGYTEPDPRDDLSGMDVARKLIILAREMGRRIEMHDLNVESLVPDELAGHDAESFLDALPAYDDAMRARLDEAQREGRVLRYVGRLMPEGTASVRLEALPAAHPFASINLTDNIVRFVSARYHDNPLVVQGPGAGPDVTAAGVFADLLRLAAYLGASR